MAPQILLRHWGRLTAAGLSLVRFLVALLVGSFLFSTAFAQSVVDEKAPPTITEVESADFFQRGESDAKLQSLPPKDSTTLKWVN